MKTVTVFANMTAKKEYAEQVLAELKLLVEAVNKEPGCIEYKLHRNIQQPHLFHFFEIWGSAELLDQHSKAPALTGFQAKMGDKLDGLDVFVTEAV